MTAATTASPASSQSTSTGRIFEALPSVNGISASQMSPGDGVIVKPFVRRRVAVQKSTVVADGAGALLHPRSQFREIFRWKLFNHLLDFFHFAHGVNLQFSAGNFKTQNPSQNRWIALLARAFLPWAIPDYFPRRTRSSSAGMATPVPMAPMVNVTRSR